MLRFAPSPTGDMHIANLRVAILNYLVARQRSEPFLIRIEDRDKEKNITGKDTEIMMILEKFALKHDAVFHQSEHLNLHQTLVLRLLKEEKAFICKCSDTKIKTEKEEAKRNGIIYQYSGVCENLTQDDYSTLKKSGEKFVIRIKKPKEKISYQDIIKGEVSTTPNKIDSFIILNQDATPSYNFACASDDMMSDIGLVIREEKHLFDTPKQIHIKKLLGYENNTEYAHIPTILNSLSVKELFEDGFIPDTILNYLLLLGNEDTPKEIFTLPKAIEWFNLEKISKSAAKFDIDKLRFINREHLKMMDDKKLSTLFGFADADIGKLAKLYLEEASTTNELEVKIRSIFSPKDFDGKWGKQMSIMAKVIADAPAFETFDEFKKHIINESGLKGENFFKPLRQLLTATGNGPELSEIYPLIKSYLLEVAS